MKTIAEQVSELFDDDGQNWQTYEGESFCDVMKRFGAKEEWKE